MTDEELRELVARTAQTAERAAQTAERAAQTAERAAKAAEQNSKAIEQAAQTAEQAAKAAEQNTRAIERQDKKTEAINDQLSLLTRRVQILADTQAKHNEMITAMSNSTAALDRHAEGVYAVLQALAKEQAERSQLIDQQIQALIDERRRA